MSTSTLADFELLEQLGRGSFGVVYKVRRKGKTHNISRVYQDLFVNFSSEFGEILHISQGELINFHVRRFSSLANVKYVLVNMFDDFPIVDGVIYVLKQINIGSLSPKEQNECIVEVQLLASLDSDYIVKYYDSFIDTVSSNGGGNSTTTLNIVMEYCDRGDLHQKLKSQGAVGSLLSEDQIWSYFIQMLIGLHALHAKKILHRDLKSMNLFLSSAPISTSRGSSSSSSSPTSTTERIKIGDLGVAKMLDSTNQCAQTLCGTPYYLSPELCEGKKYNAKSDVWASGVILYELCTLKHPFDAANQGALILKIIRGKFPPLPAIYAASKLNRVLEACLRKDTALRPTVAQVLASASVASKARALGFSLPPDVEEMIAARKHTAVVAAQRKAELNAAAAAAAAAGPEATIAPSKGGAARARTQAIESAVPLDTGSRMAPLTKTIVHKKTRSRVGASSTTSSSQLPPSSVISGVAPARPTIGLLKPPTTSKTGGTAIKAKRGSKEAKQDAQQIVKNLPDQVPGALPPSANSAFFPAAPSSHAAFTPGSFVPSPDPFEQKSTQAPQAKAKPSVSALRQALNGPYSSGDRSNVVSPKGTVNASGSGDTSALQTHDFLPAVASLNINSANSSVLVHPASNPASFRSDILSPASSASYSSGFESETSSSAEPPVTGGRSNNSSMRSEGSDNNLQPHADDHHPSHVDSEEEENHLLADEDHPYGQPTQELVEDEAAINLAEEDSNTYDEDIEDDLIDTSNADGMFDSSDDPAVTWRVLDEAAVAQQKQEQLYDDEEDEEPSSNKKQATSKRLSSNVNQTLGLNAPASSATPSEAHLMRTSDTSMVVKAVQERAQKLEEHIVSLREEIIAQIGRISFDKLYAFFKAQAASALAEDNSSNNSDFTNQFVLSLLKSDQLDAVTKLYQLLYNEEERDKCASILHMAQSNSNSAAASSSAPAATPSTAKRASGDKAEKLKLNQTPLPAVRDAIVSPTAASSTSAAKRQAVMQRKTTVTTASPANNARKAAPATTASSSSVLYKTIAPTSEKVGSVISARDRQKKK